MKYQQEGWYSLLSLEAAGWVRRNAEKAYSLGSAAIVAGQAALAALPFLGDLETELASLRADFGVEAVASIRSDDQMMVVARDGPDRTLVPSLHVGLTVPLVPPFGLAFVAWDEDAFERWLRRARRDQLVDSLAHDEYMMLDIEHQADQPVSQIAAPVFGADGRVVATLSVMAFPHELTVEEMPLVAERLRAAAAAVTRRLHGVSRARPATARTPWRTRQDPRG